MSKSFKCHQKQEFADLTKKTIDILHTDRKWDFNFQHDVDCPFNFPLEGLQIILILQMISFIPFFSMLRSDQTSNDIYVNSINFHQWISFYLSKNVSSDFFKQILLMFHKPLKISTYLIGLKSACMSFVYSIISLSWVPPSFWTEIKPTEIEQSLNSDYSSFIF